MRLQFFFLTLITWALVIQGRCDFYVEPNGTGLSGELTCASNCPQSNPCGIPSNISLDITCGSSVGIFLGTGTWDTTLRVGADVYILISITQYDVSGVDIRNLTLKFTATSLSVSLEVRSVNMVASVLDLSCPTVTILNSFFNLSDTPSSLVTAGLTNFTAVTAIKKSGSLPGFVLAFALGDTFSATGCSFDMPDLAIFSGASGPGSTEISSSTFVGNSLFARASYLYIRDSHFFGFLNSLTDAPQLLSMTNSSFTGLSSSQMLILFRTVGTISDLIARDTTFKWVQFGPSQSAAQVIVDTLELSNSTFFKFDLNLRIFSVTAAAIANNVFTRNNPFLPSLQLNASSLSQIHLEKNLFEDDISNTGIKICNVGLSNMAADETSDLLVDGLCVSSSTFQGSLTTSFIVPLPSSDGVLNCTGDVHLMSSFSSGAHLSFNNSNLTYTITNASQGIDVLVDEMPQTLHLIYQDFNTPLRVGYEYPVFPRVFSYNPSTQRLSDYFEFDFTTRLSTFDNTYFVNFTMLSITTCPCNLTQSLPCGTSLYPCQCIPPWSGPTCDMVLQIPNPTSPCTGLPPGPQFTCQDGKWVSSSSINEETFTVPAGSGTIVVNGNLTVTQTIIFQGLGSFFNVTGCIIIKGGVIVELTPSDIEEIRKGTITTTLIYGPNNQLCDSATDLSLIPVSSKSPDECVKVQSVNVGTLQTLSVAFTMTQSKCSKSYLVAIIVPSVIGGVLILTAIALIVGLRIRHNKMHP